MGRRSACHILATCHFSSSPGEDLHLPPFGALPFAHMVTYEKRRAIGVCDKCGKKWGV